MLYQPRQGLNRTDLTEGVVQQISVHSDALPALIAMAPKANANMHRQGQIPIRWEHIFLGVDLRKTVATITIKSM